MYDKYLIVGEAFKNVEESGKVTGYQLGLRLPYYRGVVLSLVGNTELTVDGERVPTEDMTVTLRGKTFPFSQFENEPVAKWEFGDVGILAVQKPGGLAPGAHTVQLNQHLKISYVPVGFSGSDTKVLTITA